MATSPQSTLCGIGSWSFSSNESPDGPSQVSSPPSTPFQKQDDALDLLYAAAGQVERLGLNSESARGLLGPVQDQPYQIQASRARFYSSQDLILQQLQAARVCNLFLILFWLIFLPFWLTWWLVSLQLLLIILVLSAEEAAATEAAAAAAVL